MARELEFDFENTDQTQGSFLACGNVVSTLRDMINRGDVEGSARLYASCTESVGDELLADIQAGASANASRVAADMFFQARDFQRAALCAEQAGHLDQAAEFHEAAYAYDKAAELYLRANKLPKAAELFEKCHGFAQAAEIYIKTNDLLRAAECFERAEHFLNAGKLFAKTGRFDRATETLQKVPQNDPSFADAVWILGNIYERSQRLDDAMKQYILVVRGRKPDQKTITIFYRLAELLAARKLFAKALFVFGQVQALDASFRDVAKYIQELSAKAKQAEASKETVEFEAKESKPTDRLIAIDPDFEFLKSLPLFAELSLDELRSIHTQAERTQFSVGQLLIQQGDPGTALYILIRGNVRVSTRQPNGQNITLIDLGPGAHVGEMALVDDAPTSANVVALEDVVAFRLTRERFAEILATNDKIALRFFRTFAKELVLRLREMNKKLENKA